jgi:hypothetical protein
MDERGPQLKIPTNITREHILGAVKEIDANGYPEKNESRKYDLVVNGSHYPPKIVISIANKIANGTLFDVSKFSGGEQYANRFLKERGFEIVPKNKESNDNRQEGIEKYSWTISNSHADKRTDKTVFAANETCLPREIVRDFFSVKEIISGDGKIILHHGSKQFVATIGMSSYGSHNTDLRWRNDFADVLRSKFPQWVQYFKEGGKKTKSSPIIRFRKRSSIKEYDVDFIEDSIALPPESRENSYEIILKKYQEYSRKDVHDIFEKNSHFTPKSGTWGIRGIISHPSNLDDFIFFVTFGRSDLGFTFEESVTESGILTWQSEPKQKVNDLTIQRLIHHDHRKNSIHLFLRTDRDRKFSYLGRLAYVKHDNERESPVLFKWQILDWDLDDEQADAMGLKLITDDPLVEKAPKKIFLLMETLPPEQSTALPTAGEKSRDFVAKKVDFAENEMKRKEIGISGEELVLDNEKKNLIKLGLSHLAREIEHISKTQGDGAGYDVRSLTPNGETKYIEVKTTVGGINTPFPLSINELNFAHQYSKNYYLYRIYDFDRKTQSGKYYILTGDISKKIVLEPTQFHCRPQIKPSVINYQTFNDS